MSKTESFNISKQLVLEAVQFDSLPVGKTEI